MTEISAKSVSDVHGIIQNYEIENNFKFGQKPTRVCVVLLFKYADYK